MSTDKPPTDWAHVVETFMVWAFLMLLACLAFGWRPWA